MRKAVLLLSSMAATVLCWAGGVVLAQEGATLAPGGTAEQSIIPGQYIVVLEEETRDPTAVAREHAQRHGARVLHTYQHALEGYAARITRDRRTSLEKVESTEGASGWVGASQIGEATLRGQYVGRRSARVG